jgi:hypothetical protein
MPPIFGATLSTGSFLCCPGAKLLHPKRTIMHTSFVPFFMDILFEVALSTDFFLNTFCASTNGTVNGEPPQHLRIAASSPFHDAQLCN